MDRRSHLGTVAGVGVSGGCITAGEPFGWMLTFRNLTDRTSGLEGTLLVELVEDGTQRVVGSRTWTIPARSTVTFDREELILSRPDTYRFVVRPHDFTWEVEATDPDEAARLRRTV